MHAPVRAESVVARGARRRLGPIFGPMAAMLYRRPVGQGLYETLRSTDASQIPMLIVLPEEDRHVSADELEKIADATLAGGHTLLRTQQDHPGVILRSWGFLVDRDAFSGRVVDELVDEEQTFLERIRGPRQDEGPAESSG